MPNTSSGASSVPETPGSGDSAAAGTPALSTPEGDQSRPSPDLTRAIGAGHDDRPPTRSLSKKVLAPVTLAVIGVALLVGAISLYTSPTDVPAPPYATIELATAFPVQFIFYTVRQLSPTIAQVTIQVALYKAAPPSKAPAAGIGLILPPGALFRTCPRLYCSRTFDSYEWRQSLQFSPFNYGGGAPALETAFVNLFVRAHSFGQASNGATAAAAMPNIRIGTFPTTPPLATQYTATLLTRYYISSANSYDWAAFPSFTPTALLLGGVSNLAVAS